METWNKEEHFPGWPVKVWAENLDAKTKDQISNTASMPFIHHHVAVMPDAHFGIGSTVGTVIPTKKAIIPAAVGVDIGCGMMAVQTSLRAFDLPDSMKEIGHSIERSVPTGRCAHRAITRPLVSDFISSTKLAYFIKQSEPEDRWGVKAKNWMLQLGTLGSGNHFIEICLDEDDKVWVMLHSGSRGVGNALGRKFIELAKLDMKIHFINLPDEDLAYIPEGTQHFDDYWEALQWAQEYASINRRLMMELIFRQLAYHFPEGVWPEDDIVNCHHNYVAKENHYGENVYVTRKGAIRARGRDLGIIPGSMGAKSYIVKGRGNQASFHSCAHGAGRKMSRRQARETFTLQDLDTQTQGVELRRRKEILDEIPGAYKDIDRVMELQKDLVEPVHTLKQILCVKGN